MNDYNGTKVHETTRILGTMGTLSVEVRLGAGGLGNITI